MSRVPLFKGGLVNLQEYTLAQAYPYNVPHFLISHRVDPKIELMYTVDSMLLFRYIDLSAIGKDCFENLFLESVTYSFDITACDKILGILH